jgi:peptide/nickel transport system substrate-binding protein
VKFANLCAAFYVTLALLACTAPPPKNPQTSSTPVPVQPTPTTTSLETDPSTATTTAPDAIDYSPANDPLVNPASVFEPLPDDPSKTASNQTLIRHIAGSPNTLNPIFWSTHYDDEAQTPIYDGYISWDKNFIWMTNPDMLESYEASEDQRLWTLHLRENLKWHDGHPLTAEDFRFTWLAILDDDVPAVTFKDDAQKIEDIRVVDPRTVQIVLKESLPINKWVISNPVIPAHIFGNPEERAKDPTLKTSPYYTLYNREGVVGSGPYKLVEWVANDKLVYERWEEFPGEKPFFKRIVLKINADRNTALQLFRKGDHDEMEVSQQQFAFETNDREFAAVGYKLFGPQWLYSFIAWNMDGSNPFFTDRRVRIAMAHALDVHRVIRDVGYNLVTPSYGIFHPDSWMFNPEVRRYEFDLERAAALLDEAGWLVDDYDGVRSKIVDGRRIKFDFELLIPNGSTVAPKVAAIFQQDLAGIGVVLRTRVVEFATMHEMALRHEFQALTMRFGTGVYPDTHESLWKTSMYTDGRNYGGYSNPRIDDLFDTVIHEFDEARRTELFREIQKVIYEDQPFLFIYNDATTYVVNRKLRGIELSPRGLTGFYPGFLKWWVAAGESMHSLP